MEIAGIPNAEDIRKAAPKAVENADNIVKGLASPPSVTGINNQTQVTTGSDGKVTTTYASGISPEELNKRTGITLATPDEVVIPDAAPIIPAATVKAPTDYGKVVSSVDTQPIAPPTAPTTPTAPIAPPPPPERGIDYAEQEKLIEAQRAENEKRVLFDEARTQKNIQNSFSHLMTQGRDNGFINARNMASVREAARNSTDSRFKINAQFNKDMFQIANDKAAQDAEFNREGYMNWVSNGNDIINAFADAGDFEGAAAVAEQYAELDGNGVWSKWSNPEYADLMEKSFDNENIVAFEEIRGKVNSIAINSALDGLNMKQSKDSILAALDTNALGKKEMIDFISLLDSSEYEGLGISDANGDVLNRVRNGQIGIDSDIARDAFADAYIRDIQDSRKVADLEARTADLPKSWEGNAMADDLYDAVISGQGGPISWDGNDGFDVSSFSVYGNDVDLVSNPAALEYIPGLDVFFRDANGEPYTPEYTQEMANSSKELIGDTGMTNAQLAEEYKSYHKGKGREYERLSVSSPEIAQNMAVLNFDSFIKTKETGEAIDPFESGKIGDVDIDDLETDVNKLEGNAKDRYVALFEADNINDLDMNSAELRQLFDDASTTGATSYNDLVSDLIKQDKIVDIDSISKSSLGRDGLIVDSSSDLYGEKGEALLKTLDENNEGYITKDGIMYKVKATASRNKQSSGAKTYHPVIVWELTPLTGGTGLEQTVMTRFSDATAQKVQSDVTGGRFLEKDAGSAKGRAQSAIDWLKGGN